MTTGRRSHERRRPWPSAIDRAQFQANIDRGIKAAYVDFLAAFGVRYDGEAYTGDHEVTSLAPMNVGNRGKDRLRGEIRELWQRVHGGSLDENEIVSLLGEIGERLKPTGRTNG